MVRIKWDGELVAEITNSRLVRSTESFRKIWNRFQRNGASFIGLALVPSGSAVLADRIHVTRELEPFLSVVERAGFIVARTGKDTIESRIEEFREELKESLS